MSVDIDMNIQDGNKLIFSNSKGYIATLLIGGSAVNKDPLSYTLPPVPPSGAFDVRFAGDLIYSENGGDILIRNDHYPLTIYYEGASVIEEKAEWKLVNTESGQEFSMWEEAIVIHSSVSELLLKKRTVSPNDFIFHQNVPNPFNPVTTLYYELPKNLFVTIIVYNILGKQIKVLVDDHYAAGSRSVLWDATDSTGRPVSAGVYLYQINVGDFVQTRKMVLLK